MRSITSNQINAMAAEHAVIVVFVRLDFTTTQYLCTAPYSIDWDGHSWIGLGNITTIEPIQESVSLEATGLKIGLSGVPSDQVSLALQENIQGKKVTVWFGVFDLTTYSVLDTPYQEFTGLANVPIIEDNMSDPLSQSPSSQISLMVEGRLTDMFRPAIRRYTDADQQRIYPGDKFFEFMPQMTEKVAIWPGIGWGPH